MKRRNVRKPKPVGRGTSSYRTARGQGRASAGKAKLRHPGTTVAGRFVSQDMVKAWGTATGKRRKKVSQRKGGRR